MVVKTIALSPWPGDSPWLAHHTAARRGQQRTPWNMVSLKESLKVLTRIGFAYTHIGWWVLIPAPVCIAGHFLVCNLFILKKCHMKWQDWLKTGLFLAKSLIPLWHFRDWLLVAFQWKDHGMTGFRTSSVLVYAAI